LNLLALLLDTNRALTRGEIIAEISGYPDSEVAARRAFERDKEMLRTMGVPIELSVMPDGVEAGYRVRPSEYYLPDLPLDGDETAALHVAITAVTLGNAASEGALMKLAGASDHDTGVGSGAPPIAALPMVPALAPLFEGVRKHAEVQFDYRGETRVLQPWSVQSEKGRWYVTGYDVKRGSRRTFRADRIEGDVSVGDARSFVPPTEDEARVGGLDAPWELGDGDTLRVTIAFDPPHDVGAIERLGDDAVVTRAPDGRTLVTFDAVQPDAVRSFVLGFLEHAEVLEPPQLRDDVVAWLQEVAARGDQSASAKKAAAKRTRREAPRAKARRPARDATKRPSSAAHPVAEMEVQRILALVPWIVAHPGVLKIEIAERFDIDPAQLDAELDLMLMVGVPPYSPGDYIDVEIIPDANGDERVTLRMAESFRRPLRLTPREGLAILAAGRTLLAVRGSDVEGPLATALAKLAAVLDLPDVPVTIAAPDHLDEVRRAAADHEELEIEYWSAGRDEVTTRKIEPLSAFYAAGEWYLDAMCLRAGDLRLFRVDRVRSVRATGRHFDVADFEPRDDVYHPRPGDSTIVLDLSDRARWVAERYPCVSVEELGKGRLRVELTVSEPAFAERLLLRLGRDADLVERREAADQESSSFSGPRAAARVLARYGATGA
jgi:predicted DNA-binding transcriptional regulator YafY